MYLRKREMSPCIQQLSNLKEHRDCKVLCHPSGYMFREPDLAVIITTDLLSASIYVNDFSSTSLPTREESTGQLERSGGQHIMP